VEANGAVWVPVDNGDERFGLVGLEAGFLPQLAQRRLRRSFSRLDLPAGKLPRASQMRPGPASGDEDFAMAHGHGEGDLDHGRIHRPADPYV
jgi:hypothetical protein